MLQEITTQGQWQTQLTNRFNRDLELTSVKFSTD
jgi:hypothetical protein